MLPIAALLQVCPCPYTALPSVAISVRENIDKSLQGCDGSKNQNLTFAKWGPDLEENNRVKKCV